MIDLTKGDLLATKIFGKALSEWDESWRPLIGGVMQNYANLRSSVGLMRAMLADKTKYIMRATELQGGLEKGMQRIRGPEQTGNAGYGAKMLRKHVNQLKFEIILVGYTSEAIDATKFLKTIMIKLHRPEWNEPQRKRMARIHSEG
jgi:hypothetical protein